MTLELCIEYRKTNKSANEFWQLHDWDLFVEWIEYAYDIL